MEPQLVRLFGMCVRSDIPLLGLEREAEFVEPDMIIELGEVSAILDPTPELEVDEAGATLTVQGVARYRISGGARIIVQPEAGAPEANVRLFLLGSAMGVLLHQRGLLPLHASAVEIEGRAVAFIGPSGAGKSTLAAAFYDQAYRVIADDVCVIAFDDQGRAFARPGIPRLRLWEEALAAAGRTADGLELSYAGDESFRKFDVPIVPDARRHIGAPLAAVFHLRAGEQTQFLPIIGSEAADAIFANTYRGEYLRTAGDPTLHWNAAIRLIRSVPIYELSRRRDLGCLAEQVAKIVQFTTGLDPR